jgi:dolichol-phosphate mannosyltransferase
VACDLSIIVPVYNEEDNILPLAMEVAEALRQDTRTYELVFVDDASIDQTWKKIQQARRQDPRVRGLKHARQCGQSAALWTGLQATASPIVATLDGDLQNDPADLPKLLAELEKFDFVCGVRTKRKDDFIRRASSRVARKARKLILGVDFCDTGCAFRVFRRSVLKDIFPFNGLHRFLPVLVHGGGSSTREIPINHRARVAGVSKYGLWNRLGRGIFDLVAMAWYQKRRVGGVSFDELRDENPPKKSQ